MDQTEHIILFPKRLDGTNTAEYLEKYMEEIKDLPKDTIVTGDLEKTTYLSSSGLRLILKLEKSCGEFRLINVSQEVYKILDMTGFAKMISVERQILKIDPITSEPIARGSNGQVYAIEKDIIVKMFTDKTAADEIREEWQNAQTALTLGVPTAICYSVVTDGERLGIMFERMETASFASLIREDYENFSSYAQRFAELFGQIHSIQDEDHELNRAKDEYYSLIGSAGYLSVEEKEKMTSFLDAVPERDNVVHGDFHPNNIGEVFGELILLDMAEIGYGNPVFDFMATYYDLIISGETVGKEHPEVTKKYFGLEVDELAQLWDIMVEDYFPGIDPEKKTFFNETVNMMLGVKLLLFPVLHPNHPKEKHEAWLKLGRERFIDQYDEVMKRIGQIDEMIDASNKVKNERRGKSTK